MNEVVDSTCIKLAYKGKVVLLDSTRFGAPENTIRNSVKIDITVSADPSDSTVYVVGLQPLAWSDCGFESRRRHGCLSLVSVVCRQVEVSASG